LGGRGIFGQQLFAGAREVVGGEARQFAARVGGRIGLLVPRGAIQLLHGYSSSRLRQSREKSAACQR